MAEFTQRERYELLIRVVLSAILLLASLAVILIGVIYPSVIAESTMKWATGIIGIIIGYWLR